MADESDEKNCECAELDQDLNSKSNHKVEDGVIKMYVNELYFPINAKHSNELFFISVHVQLVK